MKPYYDHAGIIIYHGDCREILPEIRADVVVTDPPYGIDAGNATFGNAKIRGGDWDKTTQQEAVVFAIGCSQKSIVWGGNYYDLPPSSCWLVWDKKNDCTTFADCELAWTNLPGAVRVFRWLWSGSYQEKREQRQHPTQKPIALMMWCIDKTGEEGTILDPFMGSGTSLRAAKDLGRKAIGIEIEERYCEIAAKRLAQEVLF